MKILYRVDQDNEEELPFAEKYFDVHTSRASLPANSLVVGRYSVLPFYKELEKDLAYWNSRLINTYQQHRYIANAEYINDLEGLTPRTWTDYNFCDAPEGQYVLKGVTNSKKHQWNTHMFAASKRAAVDVASRLVNDSLIGSQDLLYREYVPLQTFSTGINGVRFTNEWRFFCLGQTILSVGYYWSNEEQADSRTMPPQSAIKLVHEVMNIVSSKVNFFVVDVARTESGEWIVIELNDGQMSGLSMNSPDGLYKNLRDALNEDTCFV